MNNYDKDKNITASETEQIKNAKVPTDEEIISACFGKNEDNLPSSTCSCAQMSFKMNSENQPYDIATDEIRSYSHVEFYLEQHFNFVQVDFKFRTSLDPEFQFLWAQLSDFGKAIGKLSTAGNITATHKTLTFMVYPEKFEQYYLTFNDPMFWVMQPRSASEQDSNVIRMLVPAANFTITNIPDEIDLDDIKAEAKRAYSVNLKEAR